MGEIVVQPGRLEQVAGELKRAGERLEGLVRQLTGADAATAGSPGLADALDDFSSDWRHGLRLLGQAADRTGDQLTEAARAYRANDAAVAQACS